MDVGPGKRNIALVVFAFKRPLELSRCWQSLQKCRELVDLPTFIFCDGPRCDQDAQSTEKVRNFVRTKIVHPRLRVCESKHNKGLATSIIEGLGEIFKHHDAAIICEDDLIVSEFFLEYMLGALDKFWENESVMHISGYTFSDQPLTQDNSAAFFPFTHPWGWATWSSAWANFCPQKEYYNTINDNKLFRRNFNFGDIEDNLSHLRGQELGLIDSWWVRWNACVIENGGLALFPALSLVACTDNLRSATHSSFTARLLEPRERRNVKSSPKLPDSVAVSEEALQRFRKSLKPFRRKLLSLGRSIIPTESKRALKRLLGMRRG